MLSIGKLGIGQERYYLDKVAEGAEDYYSGEGEAEGQWIGDAAESLGLDGEVGADQLTAMLTGRNPADGEPLLGLRGVPGQGRGPRLRSHLLGPQVGLPALGASAAPVAAPPSQPPTAKRSEPPSTTSSARRAGPGAEPEAEFVKGNGYLAAGYRHRSSRNGDPQLHTHVLLANATQGPDGTLDPALPPGDLRPREDRQLHLRGPPSPRADPPPRGRVAADPQGHRRDRGLRRRASAGLLHPPRRNPRGGRAGRLGALDARSPPSPPASRRRPTSRAGSCLRAGDREPRRSASIARRSTRTFDPEAGLRLAEPRCRRARTVSTSR